MKMKKSYCDKCENEITKDNVFNNFEFELAKHTFTVNEPDAQCIDFDICKYCVIDAIKKLDDRPKCKDEIVDTQSQDNKPNDQKE